MDRGDGRLDLIGCPLDLGAPRRGAGAGPRALREGGLAARLAGAGWTVGDGGDVVPRPPPVALDPALARCRHAAAVAGWTRAIDDRARGTLRNGTLPVFLGGDHSLSMGSAGGVARACAAAERPLALLWLDAHADFNTPATTETGNLHGMALAYLVGEPSLAGLGNGAPPPVPPGCVGLFGLRDVDAAEGRALDRSGVEAVPMTAWRDRGVADAVQAFLKRLDPRAHLHVSLDLDVVDPAEAPGVGTPVPNGATRAEVLAVAGLLARDGRVGSLDLVELDPTRDPSGRSAALLVDLAATLLGGAP